MEFSNPLRNDNVQNLGIAAAAAAVATLGSMYVNGAALTVAPLKVASIAGSIAGLTGANFASKVVGTKVFSTDQELNAKNVAKVALAAILLNAATSQFALNKLSNLPFVGQHLPVGSDVLRAGSNAALFTALTALKMYFNSSPEKEKTVPTAAADPAGAAAVAGEGAAEGAAEGAEESP